MKSDVFVQDVWESESEPAEASSEHESGADGQSDLWALTIAVLCALLIMCLAHGMNSFPGWISGQLSPLFVQVGPHFQY